MICFCRLTRGSRRGVDTYDRRVAPSTPVRRQAEVAILTRPRVMIDTNIWSRLAEQGQQYQFIKLTRTKLVDVVMPPATLLEALRTQDAETRQAIIKTICRRRWKRLPTEAQSEAAELVSEIRRLRPAWMLDYPDVAAVASHEHFWRQSIYDLALVNDPQLRALSQVVGARERKAFSDLQGDQQVRFRSDGVFRSLEEAQEQLPSLVVYPDPRVLKNPEAEGWEPGTKVAPWRVNLLSVQWKALVLDPVRTQITGQSATYADWIGAYVDLSAVRRSRRDFGHLLLYEVDETRMPRNWLRRAVALVQHSMKLTRGNPVDAQLASYLPDADIFVTNDRRFARIIDAIRPAARTTYAASAYADIYGAGGNAVSAIDAVI